jgi:signal transduction histidine kinase
MVPANISVNSEISADSALVLADACQIHQVVLNLCGNAVDAMRPGPGQVCIWLQRVSADTWTPAGAFGGHRADALCLRVADNGRGMDAATQQHIFEPFFTTKPVGQGTGLGLAVVQRIVRDHQASIRVSSTPGQGTVFEVFFPILKDVTDSAPSADREVSVSDNPLHTLT